jgi:hypothetical protein
MNMEKMDVSMIMIFTFWVVQSSLVEFHKVMDYSTLVWILLNIT